MTSRTLALTDEIYDYLCRASLREPALLARLREETAALPGAGMQISPEQGQFMALLVELIGAKRCIEIGTFTGYSALSVALALPADGKVIACDIDQETTAVARRYWAEAGVADRIDLRLGPAVETLDGLIAQGERDAYDFIFIDADHNYESVLRDFRVWSPMVADDGLLSFHDTDHDTVHRVIEEELDEWELVDHVFSIKTFKRVE